MARRAKLRAQATINAAVEARSRSKKVPSANPKHAPSDYVSWIDRQKLGGIWAEGLDSWPAKRIVDERVVNGVKQYRLEWVPHPLTGQRFPPSWEPAENATDPELVREWEAKISTHQTSSPSVANPEEESEEQRNSYSPRNPPRRYPRYPVRRIIDSSSDTEAGGSENPRLSRFRPEPPRILSIPETQQPESSSTDAPFKLRVRAVPVNPSDYETITTSQIARATSPSDLPSSAQLPTTYSSEALSISSQLLPNLPTSNSQISTADTNPGSIPRNIRTRSGRVPVSPIHQLPPQQIPASGRSVTRTPSPANTEESSLLFFPSPRRKRTPQTSDSSPQSVSLSLQSEDSGRRQIPHQTRSDPGQQVFLNAQRLVQSIEDSEEDSQVPYSLGNLLAATARDSASSVGKGHRRGTGSASISLAKLQNGSKYSPRNRTSLAKPLKSPKNAIQNSGSIPSLRQGVTTGSHLQSPMATSRDENSSRTSPATPVGPANNNSNFEESIRSIGRKSRADDGNGGRNRDTTSNRKPTPVLLDRSSRQVEADAQTFLSQPEDSFSASNLAESVLTPASNHPVPSNTSHLEAIHTAPTTVDHSQEANNITSDSERMQIQQSVENEQPVPRSGGVVMPTKPIFEDEEYAISLPAEGKVQALYHDLIKSKRKSILRFIRRRDSNGVKSPPLSKIEERNDMAQLVDRLNDTVTHLDLARDDLPTQDSGNSEDHAKYATIAGSKFAFVGHLIDHLRGHKCSIVLFSKPGRVQDLLQEFLEFKGVHCQRAMGDALISQEPPQSSSKMSQIQFLLLTPGTSFTTKVPETPDMIIAFDASFDNLDPQVKSLRVESQGRRLVPIVHLLVANSSEHCDVCIPRQIPSPQRLRLLMRATYQARRGLGGGPIMISSQEEMSEHPFDLYELQKIVKKSPDRRLMALAQTVAFAITSADFKSNWVVERMPDLELEEIDDSPPKPLRGRSATPLSRAGTPSLRKRLLDPENASSNASKRQRMTPLHDVANVSESINNSPSQLESLQRDLAQLREELATEQRARRMAEEARDRTQQQLDEHIEILRGMNHRYEARMRKTHELDREKRSLQKEIEVRNTKSEKAATEIANLREQLAQVKKELAAVRDEVKNGGGDLAELERAREEAKRASARTAAMERTLENTKKDFEFTRSQYQEASTRAAEFAAQVTDLEAQIKELEHKASDEKRRLKEVNYQTALQAHLNRITELEGEKKVRESLLRRLEEEVRVLRKARAGVQTRGSSVQPPGSPGTAMGGRSRQGSPAPGTLGGHGHTALPGGRASVLRYER